MSQYHRLPADGEPPSDPVSEESKELGVIPCKPHSSRITSVCACNCGRIQDHREDPFDLKVRNLGSYRYIERFSIECGKTKTKTNYVPVRLLSQS